VRVVQRGEQAGFALETRHPVGVGERGRQHLDGDVASERRIARAINLTL
jgi:hypothetical protein